MKKLLLTLLFPVSVLAQDGNYFLNEYAKEMAMNRQRIMVISPKREQVRLDTAAATGPNYRYRALNYVWQQDYEQAATWLEKTGNQFPKENGVVGEMYLTYLHDYPQALRHFEAYDALTPTFDDIINHNPVSYMQGLAWRGLGNDRKAIELFSKAIDPIAIKHGAKWVDYRHFVSRAVSYLATHQPEKALADLDTASINFNRSALAQYYRGYALLELNRLAEARTAFQDASFFVKAWRAEHTGNSQEDGFNLIYEEEIDEAIAKLKIQNR